MGGFAYFALHQDFVTRTTCKRGAVVIVGNLIRLASEVESGDAFG
jgi:hypothetical protein